jgi:ABC-2 type transport system permease protein
MHKVFAVMRREFLERVRTKAFVIGTLLGPLFFIAIAVVPALLLSGGASEQRVAVIDAASPGFGERVVAALAAARTGSGDRAKAKYLPVRIEAAGRAADILDSLVPLTGVAEEVAPEGFDGILLINEASLTTGQVTYYGANVGSMDDMQSLRAALTPLVITERLSRAGVDPAIALGATTPVGLETRKVSQGKLTGESGEATFVLAYAMGIILYMALLLYGSQVMTSIVEEKSNRIVEVLVSSLTPFQMMLGKVVGVGLVALTQIGIWASAAYYLSKNSATVLGWFGVQPATAGGFTLPAMDPMLLVVFLSFFILGFLLFSSAYAAVGSMCSSVQDTQQAQLPVLMFIMVGFFSTFALLRDPSSAFATAAGFIPPLAPFVIPVRYSLSPIPLPELLAAGATTVIGMLAIVWVAARIYRVGILMYGKRASFKDLARWVFAR